MNTTRVFLERWEQTKVAPAAFPEKTQLIERNEYELETERCLMSFWRPTGYVNEVGFPMIEKELKRIGAMTYLPEGQGYWFGIISEAK